LSKRLKKLEAIIGAPEGDFNFEQLQQAALNKLSVPDRDLVQELLPYPDSRRITEAHRAVIDRWDEALGKTIEEIRFPFKIGAMDLLL